MVWFSSGGVVGVRCGQMDRWIDGWCPGYVFGIYLRIDGYVCTLGGMYIDTMGRYRLYE